MFYIYHVESHILMSHITWVIDHTHLIVHAVQYTDSKKYPTMTAFCFTFLCWNSFGYFSRIFHSLRWLYCYPFIRPWLQIIDPRNGSKWMIQRCIWLCGPKLWNLTWIASCLCHFSAAVVLPLSVLPSQFLQVSSRPCQKPPRQGLRWAGQRLWSLPDVWVQLGSTCLHLHFKNAFIELYNSKIFKNVHHDNDLQSGALSQVRKICLRHKSGYNAPLPMSQQSNWPERAADHPKWRAKSLVFQAVKNSPQRTRNYEKIRDPTWHRCLAKQTEWNHFLPIVFRYNRNLHIGMVHNIANL